MNTEMNRGWVKRASTAWRRCAVGVVLACPWLAWASTETTGAATTGSGLHGLGRALGMMLFGYLALRWFNRKKDDDAQRGFLGMQVKPWVVWLVVIGGLALLMARSG